MDRFEIQQEMDDEPVYVCDTATDPDSEEYEIVRISPSYGTPQARAKLARIIKAALVHFAKDGTEISGKDDEAEDLSELSNLLTRVMGAEDASQLMKLVEQTRTDQ